MRPLPAFANAALLASLVLAGSVADMTPARAAGLALPERRAEPVWIYDTQPGVIVRPYWCAPWRNRHYFPTTGELPLVGRAEDLTAIEPPPQPAESFYRVWSTSSSFVREEPRAPLREYAPPPPRDEQTPPAPNAVQP